MKNVILIFAVVFVLVSCDKKNKSLKMNAEDLKSKYAIVLPDLVYDSDEIATASPNSNKGGKKKASAQEVIVAADLCIDITGTTITGCVSPNAQWAGGQKFVDTTTTDGAIGIWGCSRNYTTPPGSGATTTCETSGTGFYRVWSSDFDYNIHLSIFKSVQ